MVVIGASAGDVEALGEILPQLAGDLSVIVVVQHGPTDRPITVSLAAPDDVAVLSIVNEGHIAAELLAQMFDPFRSGAERRLNSPGRGLGLGVYIVRQIAITTAAVSPRPAKTAW